MVQMSYNFKDQFVDNSKNTNVYIACFTTSHARLNVIQQVRLLEGESIVFRYRLNNLCR